MVDNIDQNVGKVINYLEQTGELDSEFAIYSAVRSNADTLSTRHSDHVSQRQRCRGCILRCVLGRRV